MEVNAEILCTVLLERARAGRQVESWIQVAIEFIRRQDRALRDCRDGLREELGASVRLKAAREELDQISTALRTMLEHTHPPEDPPGTRIIWSPKCPACNLPSSIRDLLAKCDASKAPEGQPRAPS